MDMTLFQCFKCSFDEYQHNLDTNDKELNEPLLYGDFLLSIRSTSSKLVHFLLIIFANQAQHLPISCDYYYYSIQLPQR
ncbi:unnamed protein product [Adineta steineri]|uniref:Uncharacterized protein n=1 Tax=Adineta steineri TaxID=433720 RepID=A0A814VPJ5_9BILA|nr:unnamed protein product [Adineta steineri]CAF1399233.1 unnamed protein product [Adineta steineri]CAF1468732.1 unnamed protein product [Adineta steineri]CAF3764026.1 unnamed protein product [Adineta steineri]